MFKERVAELRPAYLPPDPASRTTYEAGELAQFDFWFPPIELPVGATASPSQKGVLLMYSDAKPSTEASAIRVTP